MRMDVAAGARAALMRSRSPRLRVRCRCAEARAVQHGRKRKNQEQIMQIRLRALCVLTLLSASGCAEPAGRQGKSPSDTEGAPEPGAQKSPPAAETAKAETAKAEPEAAKVAPEPANVEAKSAEAEEGRALVDNLQVRVDGTRVALTWSKPAQGQLVRIVRSLNVAVDATGQAKTDAPPTLVYAGKATTATHPIAELLPDDPKAAADARHEYHYAAFACKTADDCAGPPGRASLRPTLVDSLRGGGYVIHWRHTLADLCQDVEPLGRAADTKHPGWWKSCNNDCPNATARQLNPEGIEQAKRLGKQLNRLKIPISRVISSEFCRGVQTAKNMAVKHRGKPVAIETSKHLTSFVYDEKNRCKNAYTLLAVRPAPGTNTALIGQKGNECPVIGNLDIGAAAVFKPDGQGGAKPVGVVQLTDWDAY
jgi:hypothetical protein